MFALNQTQKTCFALGNIANKQKTKMLWANIAKKQKGNKTHGKNALGEHNKQKNAKQETFVFYLNPSRT